MKVLLLAGGDSSEREVSLHSGEALYKAVKKLGHEVYVIDPATGQSLLDGRGNFLLTEANKTDFRSVAVDATTLPKELAAPELRDIDVVLLGLHGGAGENGTIQCLLDLAGLKYTGSGMRASAVAMDKALTKRLVMTIGIPTAEFQLIRLRERSLEESCLDRLRARFTLPLIVKPNDGGSTVGLTKLESWDGLAEAIRVAGEESPEVLLEKFIRGRELTVAVLDGEALPVVEIRPKKGLYDYEAKYTKGMSEYFAPADIPDPIRDKLQADAVAAYNLIGCEGLVRVDFILEENGDYYFLELNTLPGMTELSLSPMAARAVGIEFPELIDRIITSAVKKK